MKFNVKFNLNPREEFVSFFCHLSAAFILPSLSYASFRFPSCRASTSVTDPELGFSCHFSTSTPHPLSSLLESARSFLHQFPTQTLEQPPEKRQVMPRLCKRHSSETRICWAAFELYVLLAEMGFRNPDESRRFCDSNLALECHT